MPARRSSLTSRSFRVRLSRSPALTASSPPDWHAVREAYEGDAGLRVPAVVTSQGRQVAVDV